MLQMIREAFADRRVLVTGHTGFKGSWLCLWLARLGARVTGYAWEPPTEPNHFTVGRVQEMLDDHIIADVRDTQRLTEVIQASRPDLILHLAAQSVVRYGYREPLETFSINVMGTASVLEAIRLWNQPCAAVIVTSDKCYENREQAWGYRETDPLGDHDPYGGSKGAAELVTRSYRDSYFHPSRIAEHGVKIASARAGNVIGGGDWTSHALVVDLVHSLENGEPVAIRAPDAYRPWQHVLQALSGYLALAAKLLNDDCPQWCKGWNFGPQPGSEIAVRDFVDRFLTQWGSGTWRDQSDPHAPREATILRLCIDQALWELDWRPCWSIDETLSHTLAWYRQWLQTRESQESMQPLSLQQIEQYELAMLESTELSHR